jgi:PAS domain S-box-containing protein
MMKEEKAEAGAQAVPAGEGCVEELGDRFGALVLMETLMLTAPVGIGFFDHELRFVRVNERLAEINGLSVAEHLGRRVEEIVPSLEGAMREVVGRVLATGEPVKDHEFCGETAKAPGVTRWWNESWYPVRDAAGEIAGFGVVVEEISERKAAERELVESRGRMRAAAEVARMTYFDLDIPAGTVRLAENFAAVMGYAPPTTRDGVADLGATLELWLAHLSADDREVARAGYAEMLAGNLAGKAEYRLIGDDGNERWIEAATTTEVDADGRLLRAFSINLDITQRKQAEAALEETAGLFKALIEQAPMGVYLIDGQFRVQHVSAEAREVFRGVDGLIGRDFSEVIRIVWGPVVGGEIAAIFRRTLATGERYVSPKFVATRGDLAIEEAYDWEIQRVTLPDGQSGVVCYFREVTESVRAEQAIRASEERMRLATTATGVGIWEWNYATGMVRWDAQMFRIYGIEPTADGMVPYATWEATVLPEDMPIQEAALAEALRNGFQSGGEFRIRRGDGEVRQIRSVETVRRDGAGEVESIVGTNLDITAEKAGFEAVRASGELVRAVLDSLPEHVAVLDEDGVVTMVNEPWERFAIENGGNPAGVSVGVNYLEVCRRAVASGDGAAAAALRGLEDVLAGRLSEFTVEYPCHAPDQQRWFLMHAKRALHGGGIVLSHIDISERKQAEQALQQADRRKDEFLATLAHELRNPLAPLRSGLEVMRMAADSPAVITQMHGIMERQLGQLVRLVDDLLDVSRITYGKLELRKELVDLASVLTSAVETSRHVIEEREHRFSIELPSTPVILNADLTRLAQVFLNLLTNAAKYSERGGEIWLSAVEDGAEVVVSVRDRGIGIAADQLSKIFEPFSQIDQSLEKSQGGLGIGLMLVRRLVEMHGGSVVAHSDGLGMGSEFSVRLPCVPRGALASQHPGSPGSVARARTRNRVMIADDNQDAAATLRIFVELMGFKVATADDGIQAVELAATFQPDVILMDIGMPGLNGYDACRRIRQQPWSGNTVFIALTGWGQNQDRQRSKAAGFAHHLVKPVDPARLRELLESVVG